MPVSRTALAKTPWLPVRLVRLDRQGQLDMGVCQMKLNLPFGLNPRFELNRLFRLNRRSKNQSRQMLCVRTEFAESFLLRKAIRIQIRRRQIRRQSRGRNWRRDRQLDRAQVECEIFWPTHHMLCLAKRLLRHEWLMCPRKET